jgi:hypothetical protein
MGLPLTTAAVRVQSIEFLASDEYQSSVANARMDRIAKANQANVTASVAEGANPRLFLVSFAKRVDASTMVAEAERDGLAVKEIHLSIGETQNAFPFVPEVPASDQLASLRTYLLDDLSERALELKRKIDNALNSGGKPAASQAHWWKEELRAINEFQRHDGSLPLVANGVEVLGSGAAVERFVTSTKIPVAAVELSSVGIKRFAIPLDVYRAYREAE